MIYFWMSLLFLCDGDIIDVIASIVYLYNLPVHYRITVNE